jgi:NAD(P)H-nitrite reductase large subunit
VTEAKPTRFVCRCEEIGYDAIESAIGEGCQTLNDLKRRTRAGMGVCQGVYCLPEMAEMLAGGNACAVDELSPMTSRPPARLITLRELAELGGAGEDR